MRSTHLLIVLGCLVAFGSGPALAQATQPRGTINARIEYVPKRPGIIALNLQEEPFRRAIGIWEQQSGRQVVVNWRALELAGIDPETPITLRLARVPVMTGLTLILRQASPGDTAETDLIADATPWYVKVWTKSMANRRPVTKLYFIGDVLHEVPSFDDAPSFSLTDALSNTNSGGGGRGGGGGSNQGIFDQDNDDSDRKIGTSRQQRGEQLAQAIRDTIEPEIWKTNGGRFSSIRYRRNYLIVRAPMYVHRQIGIPEPKPRRLGAKAGDKNNTQKKDRKPLLKPVSSVRR